MLNPKCSPCSGYYRWRCFSKCATFCLASVRHCQVGAEIILFLVSPLLNRNGRTNQFDTIPCTVAVLVCVHVDLFVSEIALGTCTKYADVCFVCDRVCVSSCVVNVCVCVFRSWALTSS